MDLTQYRKQIDDIDNDLLALFCRRMEVSAKIAAYKHANQLPIFMPEREREKINTVSTSVPPEMAAYAKELYAFLFSLSKHYQEACLSGQSNK